MLCLRYGISGDSMPKYSLLEIERRWLVDLAAVGDLSILPWRDIEDLYVAGSRLRLRKMSDAGQGEVFKLAKKYGKSTALSEAVTNLYLTAEEYQLLSLLPGCVAAKRRYLIAGGGLDVYLRPHAGLAIFEREFADEASARRYQPPSFATREVTAEPEFRGVSLAEGDAV